MSTKDSQSDGNKLELTGKNALLAWNRVASVLEEHGVNNPLLAKSIVTRLVAEDILDGEFFIPGVNHTGNIAVVKLTPEAVVPNFAHATDAGADLVSVETLTIAPFSRALVGTGIAVAIPLGKVGLIHPRSGLAAKSGITVLNTPGTIDSGYRGELKVILYNSTEVPYDVVAGDRIAQFVIQNHDYPLFIEVQELSDSDRGLNGFGSTGKS